MNQKIKTIFIGTPDFGVPALQSLITDNDFEIIGVITQPDKKIGRKQILTPPPIKTIALKHGIPLYQPTKIRDWPTEKEQNQTALNEIDLIIVIAYAQLIPKRILDLPKYGCVNVHGSLLPKYRGASCIQAAIINGDKETGITIMKMDVGLDTGPIICKEKISINNTDTAGDIFNKLSILSGKVLPEVLKRYISQEIKPEPQDNSQSSYVGMLKKEDGRIEWSKSAEEIERFVRAMSPWPGAYSTINSKIKIISTEQQILNINQHKPGTLFIESGELSIQCGSDALIIKQLQLEGKKTLTAKEFLNGHKNLIGSIFK